MILKPLPGRVFIDHKPPPQFLWTPDGDPRKQVIHRGKVVMMGEDIEDFRVGDEVYFIWTHSEKAWTVELDGRKLAVVPKGNVQAVVE